MKRCVQCVMPDTRPDLSLDLEGVCNACRSVAAKNSVDWGARGQEWRDLCGWAKGEAHRRENPYDCICAVSGGKDSTFIVLHALAHGLRPLGVSFEPDKMTPTGQENLENLQDLGCDVVQFKKRRDVYRRMGRAAFETVGDHSWPNHVGIFTTVVREATLRNTPLILWGENPQAEYGAPNESARSNRVLDRAWLEEFGGLLGLRVRDLVSDHGFSIRDLAPYQWPSVEDLDPVGIRSVFLGYYQRWDTLAQVEAMKRRGFRSLPDGAPIGSLWDFENVDDAFVDWHDYLGYVKYGYGRACAQASIAIRHGYMTRAEGIAEVLLRDGKIPIVGDFAEYLGIDPGAVIEICNRFTNPALFQFNGDRPRRDGDLQLVPKFEVR